MVVTKWRVVRVVLVFFLVFLAGAFFLSAQTNISTSSPLESLLNGSSTDIPGALSSLNDADLPLALAVVEALKFKASHEEISLSRDAIDSFSQGLEARLAKANSVSISKTDACPVSMPSREQVLAGVRLTVPAHFVAVPVLTIADFGPQDEAGTPFPDIWVSFFGAKKPVVARFSLDGIPIPAKLVDEKTVLCRPDLEAKNILTVGTHTAAVSLTDAGGHVSSASWSFTVGVKSVTTAPCPEDAAVIASLTVSLETLLHQPGHPYSVTILVRVDSAGKRFIQYVVPLVSKNACGSFLRTDSLVALSRFFRRESEPPKVTVFPRTRFAFPGNTLAFSYVYSGPGKIIEETWETGEIGKRSRSAPTIKLEKKSVTVNCLLKVELDIGGEAPIIVEVNGGTTVNPLVITSHVTEREALFTPNGTGTIDLHWGHGSPILNELDVPIPPEGGSVSFSGGTLEASRNRVIRHSGSVSPKIADPASSPCRLQFDKPGYAEFVFDLQLQYRFQEETYSWASTKPEISALAGVFQTSGKMEFVRIPPGIIEGTARFLDLKKLTIDINGLAKTVLRPGDLVFDPPWELARSSLFPASPPIALTKIIPEVLGTIEDGSPSLPMESENGFRHKIDSLGLAQNDGEFLLKVCYRLFPTDSNMGSPLVPILSPLPIKALPATIARVEIDPPGPSTIREGEKLELAGTAMPQEELGTGEINETENTFDLLDGYKASRGSIEWLSWLSNEDEEGKRRDDGWKFPFKPEVGLGTYSVLAVSTIDVREEETGSEIQVIGTGSTQVVVIPGLRILSPIDKYVYPQGAEVAVVTTIDKDPEEWQKIQWTLNGKPWNPGTSAPPARLLLDKSQKWRLGAQLKTVDSENHELILSDTVSFQTKPFSASLTPKRAIYPWKAEFSVPLPIEVKLNNTPIKELKKEVPLVPGEFVAWVEDITWVHGADPESCATFEVGASPFQASMKFSEPGAFTTLATVTIKVKPIGGDSDSEENLPILTFSYTLRSDLWAIPQPKWLKLDGKFRSLAVVNAKRTYRVDGGVFQWGESNVYEWAPNSGITPKITLNSALPGIHPIEGSVMFHWECPENQMDSGLLFRPIFKSLGLVKIQLVPSLVFPNIGQVEFILPAPIQTTVKPLSSLIDSYVKPASFSLKLGEECELAFFIAADEAESQTSVNIASGPFFVSIENIEWRYKSTIIGNSNPLLFKMTASSSGTIHAEVTADIQETDFPEYGSIGKGPLCGDSKFDLKKIQLKRLAIRKVGTETHLNSYTTSYRKETTCFEAVGYGNYEGDSTEIFLGRIPVNWRIESGLATDSLSKEILPILGNQTGLIGVIDQWDSTLLTDIATFTSYLPGTLNLVIEKNQISETLPIRITQPTIWLSIKGIDGIDNLSQITDWISETKRIWLQENHFVAVKIRHGTDISHIPSVLNKSFEPLPPSPTLPFLKSPEETLALGLGGFVWLSSPLVDDFTVRPSNGRDIVPRLSRELLWRQRSDSLLPKGDQKDINIYVVKQGYYAILLSPFSLSVQEVAGWTISQDEYFQTDGFAKLVDYASSGIVLSLPNSSSPRNKDLAHEIGHLLIQQGLYVEGDHNEHVDDPSNLMGTPPGASITATQAIMILDYERKKPPTSNFIWEE